MSTTGREAATAEQAQVPGITRIDLQRQDLSAPGREVIQNRVEISDEAPAIRHKHPVRRSSTSSTGRSSIRSTACPRRHTTPARLSSSAETVHAVRNVGEGNGAELATYVIEKGKPFIVLAED